MILSFIFLAVSLSIFNNFIKWVELRPGVVLDDVLLNRLPVFNLEWLIFILIYGSLILAIFASLKPKPFLKCLLQGYSWLLWFRMVVMTLVPLDPPPKMIVLHDPLVEFFGSQRILTKDLFFSGHTATLFLVFLMAHEFSSQNLWAKRLNSFFLLATFTVALSVLIQHVHYSIDVFAAPLFSWLAFRWTLRFQKFNISQFKFWQLSF